MTVDQYLSLSSLLLVIVGGIFAGFQWQMSNKTKRIELINQIIEKLRFDQGMAQTMYRIDYGKLWYDEKFHTGTELEFAVDKLLSYFSYICYLKKTKNISGKEFSILQYEVNRVCNSNQVQSYLWNLYHFSKQLNSKCSFDYLISYGIENKLFDDSFSNKHTKTYIKRLNF
jgi:hypothetical protein